MLITAMASTRKEARRHIAGQQAPLLDLVCQIYAFGDTQTLQHWKKELRASISVIRKNLVVKGGKLLKEADIVSALESISAPLHVKLAYADLQVDPDYSSLQPRRLYALSSSNVMTIVELIARQSLNAELTAWGIADQVIEEILSW